MAKLTPMMEQYMELKKEYSDCILFFRLGDFYEMFFEDAIKASRELEITLTQRSVGDNEKAAMCGIPHHVADNYIAKLVDKGYKVAIGEQVEDPKDAKGIVKRDVVKVVTPGTITDQTILDDKVNNYLASIYLDKNNIGIAYVDNSTGELSTTSLKANKEDLLSFAINEISKIYPSEIICNEEFYANNKVIKTIKNNLNPYFNVIENDIELDWKAIYSNHFMEEDINKSDDMERFYSNIATVNLLKYLETTEKNALDHISTLEYYEANNYLIMDFSTRINLEIHETIISRDKKGSIVGFLDKTNTSMGGRLLRKWLEQPLIDKKQIEYRNSIVEFFVNNMNTRDSVSELLKNVHDIERLSTRVSTGSCNGRDMIALKNSISQIPDIKTLLRETGHKALLNMEKNLDELRDIYKLIDDSIMDNPPVTITEGNLIKLGFDENLDRIKEVAIKGKSWLKDLEEKEKEKTGINNLKIGYNKMLGYYFEVTKGNMSKVPEYFIRKQTLTNAERFFTEELKGMENEILTAEDKLLSSEYKVFVDIREKVKSQIFRIQTTSKFIATLDVLVSFAQIAFLNSFSKPELNTSGTIEIKDGRHPVVESNIDNNLFVPNDTNLDLKNNMIQIITGPNMAGKSTYMRQVAIITLLAHIGSFVPAESANISVVDRIFTRIGAADNLSQGESTFMVEMNEVANIVETATSRSLIILDEVGRGTSTYDGLSIARALIEYIAENIRAKTLFATHYHELTDLEDEYKNIKNLTILAEEKGEDVIFLRKIVEGSTNKSYGIQVARLAGIDKKIIDRANEILYSIEKTSASNLGKLVEEPKMQLDLNDFKKKYFIDNLSNIEINNLTPMEGFNRLYEIIQEAKELKDDFDE